jgi:hypothetical protein
MTYNMEFERKKSYLRLVPDFSPKIDENRKKAREVIVAFEDITATAWGEKHPLRIPEQSPSRVIPLRRSNKFSS